MTNNLKELRKPFLKNQISKRPNPTPAQTKEVKNNFKAGFRCQLCGGWHHPKAVHFDYVGHAALTDRLLDVDPEWNWKPMSTDDRGQPLYDSIGGLWIELTICGITRIGYGNADGKTGGNAIKEVIGDALRNAAMRFGAGLDLWHKGELHIDEEEKAEDTLGPKKTSKAKYTPQEKDFINTVASNLFRLAEDNDELGLIQSYTELSTEEANLVWPKLMQDTQKKISDLLNNQAA